MEQFSSFHEVRFPTDIALSSSGGPHRKTEIITLGSGHEQRNARWRSSRRKYDVGYGVKSFDDLYRVIEFFEARRGALHGFRFRDPMDWKSCAPLQQPKMDDQIIGTGDGVQVKFQVSKIYGPLSGGFRREIYKVNSENFKLAVDGNLQIEGTHYSLDVDTGLVTFMASHIPLSDAQISAGFTFDVPVRFSLDQLDINLAAFEAGEIVSIPLIEVVQ